jgi:hypothetical protein
MRFAPSYGLVVMMLALANGHIGQNTSRFHENILTIKKAGDTGIAGINHGPDC